MTKSDLLGLLGEPDDPAILQCVKLSGAKLFPQAATVCEEQQLLVFDGATHGIWHLQINISRGKFSGTASLILNLPTVSQVTSINCSSTHILIASPEISNGGLFTCTRSGESLSRLVENGPQRVIHGAIFNTHDQSILFTDTTAHQIFQLHSDSKVVEFSGRRQEDQELVTSTDGLCKHCTHAQCTSIVMMGKSVLVADQASASLRIISDLQALNNYHQTISQLYMVFKVHTGNIGYRDSLGSDQVSTKLDRMCNVFRCMLQQVRDRVGNSALKPSGQQGSLPYVTMMMFEDLTKNTSALFSLVDSLNRFYTVDTTALLSVPCEHHFSVMRSRYAMPTMLQYCQQLNTVIAETLKRMTVTGYVYYTSKDSFYPHPEFKSVVLSKARRPARPIYRALSSDDRRLMLNWRQDFCAGKESIYT